MPSLRPLVVVVVAAALTLAAPGCTDASSPACSGPPTFDNINQQIFAPSCAHFSVCHDGSQSSPMGDLDLKTDPYKALVNVATACKPNCTTARADFPLRVKPGDPDHSFLWVKINMSTGTSKAYGDRMPASNNPPLDDSCKQLIHDWIANLGDAGVTMPDASTPPDASMPADASTSPDGGASRDGP
jgi:hypothetical protein